MGEEHNPGNTVRSKNVTAIQGVREVTLWIVETGNALFRLKNCKLSHAENLLLCILGCMEQCLVYH